jgi:hypothetical protein
MSSPSQDLIRANWSRCLRRERCSDRACCEPRRVAETTVALTGLASASSRERATTRLSGRIRANVTDPLLLRKIAAGAKTEGGDRGAVEVKGIAAPVPGARWCERPLTADPTIGCAVMKGSSGSILRATAGRSGIGAQQAFSRGIARVSNAPMIGIGGHLAMPPLPHHRAYGSSTTAV